MNTKNNRRVQMTKKMFQNALIELMQEKPFSLISIKEICDRADLNRSTFYLHYKDPRFLMQEIEQNVRERLLDYMRNLDGANSPLDNLVAFLSYIKQHRDVFSLVFNDEEKHFYADLMREVSIIIQVKDWVHSGQKYEDYIIAYTMNGSSMLVKQWLAQHCDLNERELALIIRFFALKRELVTQEVAAFLSAEAKAEPTKSENKNEAADE